jgi:hypothetical protein
MGVRLAATCLEAFSDIHLDQVAEVAIGVHSIKGNMCPQIEWLDFIDL